MTSGKPDRAKYMSKIERKMANLMGQSFKTGIISTSPWRDADGRTRVDRIRLPPKAYMVNHADG
jgi:hypothetical protein